MKVFLLAMGMNRGMEIGSRTLGDTVREQYESVNTQTALLKLETINLQRSVCELGTVLTEQLGLFIYKREHGNGFIHITDANAGEIHYIRVNPELSGQTIYVQLVNANGITDFQAEADSNGFVPVSPSTVQGANDFYITTQSYAFPPTGDDSHGELDGEYVNLHTDENGHEAYDFIRCTNGVLAMVRYLVDLPQYVADINEVSEEQVLLELGKRVRYIVTDTPGEAMKNGQPLYMKKDGYPYGTLENPAYVRTYYPNPNCQVYYIAEYYRPT